MNRLGVQLKKFFEETPLPEGQESWGAWRDAEDKAEGKPAFPDVTHHNEASTLPWRCTNPACGHRLME